MRGLVRSVSTFAVTSGIGTLAHYAVLVLGVELLSLAALWATTAGFCVGGICNYFLTRRFVFRSPKPHGKAAPQFLLMALLGMGLNASAFALFQHMGLFYVLAQIAATGCVFIWSYSMSRWVVFK